ncbi:MAG: hypothetical protein WCS89_04670 [Candidatus Paceibacterota bacterium]
MKNFSPSLTKIASATGLFFGIFAISALASDWIPATGIAPNNNTPAPINVSTKAQYKLGSLAIGTASPSVNPATLLNNYALEVEGSGWFQGGLGVGGLTITNTLKVGGNDSDKPGYVLANDGSGNAQWKSLGVLNSNGSGGANTIGNAGNGSPATEYVTCTTVGQTNPVHVSTNPISCTAFCPAGKHVVGGGCDGSALAVTAPNGDRTGWRCSGFTGYNSSTITGTAICQ